MADILQVQKGGQIGRDNDPEWPDLAYGANPPKRKSDGGRIALDWRALLALGALVLIVGVPLWLVYRFGYCARFDDPCRDHGTWVIGTAYTVTVTLLVLWLVTWYGARRAHVQAATNEARRLALVGTRYGDSEPLSLYEQPVAQAAELFLARYLAATQLEQAIAPHKRYSGVETLNEGAQTNVSTDLGAPPPPALPAPELPTAGILASWRAQGWIDRSGESLVAGIRPDGKPELIDLRDCGYIAVGGRTRSGKTSTVVSWLCQGAVMGWQFVICDKHANKPDGLLAKVAPLERAFALEPAREPAAIGQRIREVDAIGRERLRLGGHHPALFLVIDEYTNMILRGELSDKDLDILLSIAIEYAGVNIHGIIIGQGWAGNMVGKERGASQRRAMTHRMIHPCDPAEAAFLLPSGYQKMVTDIRKGQAIYFADEAPSVLAVPFFGPDEVSYAAQHIPAHLAPLAVPDAPAPVDPRDAAKAARLAQLEHARQMAAAGSEDVRRAIAADLARAGFSTRAMQYGSMLRNEVVCEIWRDVTGSASEA